MERNNLTSSIWIALVLAVSAPAFTYAKVDAHTRTQPQQMKYKDWTDPAMGAVAVNAGRALIEHLRSAQALVDEGSVTQARGALIDSRDFADALERMMPYLVVVEDITDAKDKLLGEDVDVFYDELLPIYASLDQMKVYAPAVSEHARKGVKHAEAKARSGDTKGASATLQDVANELEGTTVYLPIEYVDGQIRAALNALKGQPADVSLAKKAVTNALHSLTAVSVSDVASNP